MAELRERPHPPGRYGLIVVGSGPGGLQLTHSLQRLGVPVDYGYIDYSLGDPLTYVALHKVIEWDEAKLRKASGVTPRRRRPLIVGRRGSSQPRTRPSFTSCMSLRLLITV